MNKRIRAMNYARENAVGINEGPSGVNIPILCRNRHKETTETCPFCGDKHIHGLGNGHRIPHCAPPYESDYVMGRNAVFKNKHGEIFEAENGYYIETYP